MCPRTQALRPYNNSVFKQRNTPYFQERIHFDNVFLPERQYDFRHSKFGDLAIFQHLIANYPNVTLDRKHLSRRLMPSLKIRSSLNWYSATLFLVDDNKKLYPLRRLIHRH